MRATSRPVFPTEHNALCLPLVIDGGFVLATTSIEFAGEGPGKRLGSNQKGLGASRGQTRTSVGRQAYHATGQHPAAARRIGLALSGRHGAQGQSHARCTGMLQLTGGALRRSPRFKEFAEGSWRRM